RARRSFDQNPTVVSHRAGRENENAAGLAEQRTGSSPLKIALQSVRGLVEDDEVKVHAAAAGIAMPLHELVGQCVVVIAAEPCQARTIGRSPEMAYGQRPGCPSRLAATASAERRAGSVKSTAPARRLNNVTSAGVRPSSRSLVLPVIPGAVKSTLRGLECLK